MRPTSPDPALRRGWTTGSCATAAAKAAYGALLGRGFASPVTLALPRGGAASFALAESLLAPDGLSAVAAVVKDAGDDPDVTHGCLVRVTVARGPAGSGVRFAAGPGVGTVTLPGLQLPPGEPAINPVPRAMIQGMVIELARAHGDPGDLLVTVEIPGGEALAERTMNGRLGIKGGLSILGTTGVVVPFSCAAWIHSIHRGVDVARAAGLDHIAAATGSTSEAAVRALHRLPEMALIDMGDFVGATMKYIRRHPVHRLSIAGGMAKLAKLAQGALDLHSSRSEVDLGRLMRILEAAGADAATLAAARAGHSAAAVARIATAAGIDLAGPIARDARTVAMHELGDDIQVEVIVVDRDGKLAGHAHGW